MKNLTLAVFAAGCISSIGLHTDARADTVTYDYTGAAMSGTVTGSFIGPGGEGGTFPYCCSEIVGQMTLSSALAPNLNNVTLDPIAMVFSLTGLTGPVGGLPDIGYGAGAFGLRPDGEPPGLFAGISLSTDAQGAIIGWNLSLQVPTQFIDGSWQGSSLNGASGVGDSSTYDGGTHGPDYTVSNGVAGSWDAASATVAPEIDPAGATAALTLLLGFMAVVRGRRLL